MSLRADIESAISRAPLFGLDDENECEAWAREVVDLLLGADAALERAPFLEEIARRFARHQRPPMIHGRISLPGGRSIPVDDGDMSWRAAALAVATREADARSAKRAEWRREIRAAALATERHERMKAAGIDFSPGTERGRALLAALVLKEIA